MNYFPYIKIGKTPNIIVDGARLDSTVLALSHWPGSGTPPALHADTSTEIAFKYLDDPARYPHADAVSNNHFDEDGLAGLFTLVSPEIARQHRQRLIDVATAGDFGIMHDRTAVRIALAIAAHADPDQSPLDAALFARDYPSQTAALYAALIPQMPRLLENPDAFAPLWRAEDELIEASQEAIEAGKIKIEENRALDMAIVRLPEGMPGGQWPLFTHQRHEAVHPVALHTATSCLRILLVQGRACEFYDRYESWLQYASRRPLARVDLAPLALQLTRMETDNARWEYDGVDNITPCLRRIGERESKLDPDVMRRSLEDFLAAAPPAWNPYGGAAT